jgi:CheY-like chemotaxis protein
MATKKVLVIEDNELNMKLIRALLQMGNYQALEASDAETGIQMAADHKPDLILMDIQLPGMDGLSATQIIKANPELKATVVVALTGYAMPQDRDQALAAGCVGFITKPIDTRSFLDTLAKYL